MSKVRHFKLADQPLLGPGPVNPDFKRRPVGGENTMIMEVRLKKGFDVPRHNHPEEQFTYVISGTMKFWTDDEPEGFIVGPGDLLHFPPNVYHQGVALEDVVEIDVFYPIRPDLLGPLIPDEPDK